MRAVSSLMGREATIERPADADALGLGMVYQHFTLVPSMTVAENLVIVARPNVPAVINWRERNRPELRRVHGNGCRSTCRWRLTVGSAGGGRAAEDRDHQTALSATRKFLVLDEPTSVLTPQEADRDAGAGAAVWRIPGR